MHDDLQTLSKMFTESLFRIPDYQRGYAWTSEQIEDFWSDIAQIEDSGNHYTGVLTLETVPTEKLAAWEEDQWILKSKSYSPFYVVDGQQRLTTSILLIRCITETLGKDEELNYTTKREIQKKFLFDAKTGSASRSYIFGYEKDNPSYEYLKTEIFGERSASARKEETVYTNNLYNAKAFFADKLAKLDRQEIENLYLKVTQRLLFNIFVISQEVDVCVAFETMNNRGRPLTHLELLKNRLIYLTTRLNAEPEVVQDLRRTINECWKTVYHFLGRNKEKALDDDFFLKAHYLLKFVDIAPKGDQPEDAVRHRRQIFLAAVEPRYTKLLNEIFTFGSITERRKSDPEADTKSISDINEYSQSLSEAVRIWYEIYNPISTDDRSDYRFWLAKLNRLKSHRSFPIVLSIMLATTENDVRTRAFKAFERIHFINSLAVPYPPRYDDRFIESLEIAIKIYRGEPLVEELIEVFDTQIKTLLTGEANSIRERLKGRNYYTWRSIGYFLFEYNLELQLGSKTDREKIEWKVFDENEDDYASVEHIYPYKAQNRYWLSQFQNLTASQRDTLRNTIGNLLPLSKPKNSSLSNASYPDKVKGAKGTVGYAYGSYAENEVTQTYDDWNPQSILDRSLHLLDFIEYRWGIPLGTDEEKIKLLGLGFVSPCQRRHPRRFTASTAHATRLAGKRSGKHAS